MDETLAAKVQGVVTRVDRSLGRDPFMDRLNQAIEAVGQTLPEVDACTDEDVAVVVVMTLLGPAAKEAGPPPEAQQQELRGLLHRYRTNGLDEIATAYGCGFGRTCAIGRGTWGHGWPNAHNQLTQRAVLPAVERIHRFLAELNIPGYPEKRAPGDLKKDASLLTLKFVQGVRSANCARPEAGRIHSAWQGGIEVTLNAEGIGVQCAPPGSRILLTPTNNLQVGLEGAWRRDIAANTPIKVLARDEDARIYPGGNGYWTVPGGATSILSGPATIHVWNCTCGWTKCAQQHRLASWEPTRHSLWNFTVNAICGPTAFPRRTKKGAPSAKAKATPKIGSLVNGMYLPHLIHEEWLMPRLRAVDVEFNVCRCGTKYEGEKCPGCDKPFDDAQVQRIARLWLIVFADQIPDYEYNIRYRCQRRADHFRRIHELREDEPIPDKVSKSKKWDNYCEPTASRCPLCDHPVDAKESHVWKRVFPRADSLDDPNFEPYRLLTDTHRRKPKLRRDSHD